MSTIPIHMLMDTIDEPARCRLNTPSEGLMKIMETVILNDPELRDEYAKMINIPKQNDEELKRRKEFNKAREDLKIMTRKVEGFLKTEFEK